MAARMWTSFVTDLDPNGHGGEFPFTCFRGLHNENAGVFSFLPIALTR